MPIDIMDRKMTYYNGYASFCFQNCLRQILELYDIENAPFLINSALTVIVKKEEGTDFGYIVDENDNSRSVLPKYAKKVNRLYPDDRSAAEVWKSNKAKIDEGILLITGVDIYHLEYLPYYKKNHGIHTVILCDYSEQQNTASIIDWYEPHFFKGKMALDNFLEARASDNPWDGSLYSGILLGKNWAEVEVDGWVGTKEELFNQTIDLTIEQYYKKTCKEANCEYQGIFGLRILLDIVKSNFSKNDDYVRAFLKNLHQRLYVVQKRKRLFSLYLNLNYESSKSDKLSNAIVYFDDIISKWESLLLLIIKSSIRYRDDIYLRIIDSLEEVIKLEEGFYDYLIRLTDI